MPLAFTQEDCLVQNIIYTSWTVVSDCPSVWREVSPDALSVIRSRC